jgi:hypothetical protein
LKEFGLIVWSLEARSTPILGRSMFHDSDFLEVTQAGFGAKVFAMLPISTLSILDYFFASSTLFHLGCGFEVSVWIVQTR